MIYVDSSVALAQLLFKTRAPPDWLWREPLVSSRLFEYELWKRVHAYHMTGTQRDDVRAMLALVDMIEMTRPILARALEPFPVPVRTLDGLHLATMDFMRRHDGEGLELASYDGRLQTAARALGIEIAAV